MGFNIKSNQINGSNSVYFIGEVGINHNGDMNIAKKLIDANPKVVFLYNFLGLISAEQKKIDIALKYYEEGYGN